MTRSYYTHTHTVDSEKGPFSMVLRASSMDGLGVDEDLWVMSPTSYRRDPLDRNLDLGPMDRVASRR